MQPTAGHLLKTYVTLTLLSTLASSFIWGINTLFLLDAGLSVTQAFAANAFFTLGQVLFEVPTGVVADMLGRRASYLLGTATLLASTLLYLLMWQTHGPFWAWAVVSMLLGLGFSFFSGATEAWLVDGLNFTKYTGTLESAFAKGQIAGGVAMLAGTVAGGAVAQATSLGVPYLLRAVMLGLTLLVAFYSMHDVGFTPRRNVSVWKEMASILRSSFDQGLRNPPVRWLMLAAPFSGGVGIYAFYAMQPYLLELYGRSDSYAIAGLAAAVVAATQIVGGYVVVHLQRAFRRRTSFLLVGTVVSAAALAPHRARVELLGCLDPAGSVGDGVLGLDPGPAGVPQRLDSVGGTSHRPLGRQPPRLVRGRRRPAGARPGRRRLELRRFLCRRRRRRAAGPPVHGAGPA